ncbi:TPA: hypothetical protein ACGFTC_001566 [Yersinia enterocolitica]
MKKLKFDFRLSHILFFFFGVMVTVVLLWVLYKDPTRITAPALAALTAMCTFLLALWSAFKVNKWLNNKVNDSAYKQTEKIIESISTIQLAYTEIMNIATIFDSSELLTAYLHTTPEIKDNTHTHILKYFDFMSEHCNSSNHSASQLNVLVRTLSIWNVKLKDDNINNYIQNIIYSNYIFTSLTSDIKKHYYNKNPHFMIASSKKLVNEHVDLGKSLSFILNLKYDDIFMFNVKSTSPSEKVSE